MRRRLKESEEIWDRLEELCAERRLPRRAIGALFDATLGMKVRNASYRASLRTWDERISNQGATDDPRAMVAAGLLERSGAKRGAFYTAADPLRRIADSVRRGRTALNADSLFNLAS